MSFSFVLCAFCVPAVKRDVNEEGPGGTQEYITKMEEAIMDGKPKDLSFEDSIYQPTLTSIMVPGQHNAEKYGTRKPDMVGYRPGEEGGMSILWIGDVKRSGMHDFGNDEIGHVLDMALSLYKHQGGKRPFIITFLTDGARFQFFKVFFDDDVPGKPAIKEVELTKVYTEDEAWAVRFFSPRTVGSCWWDWSYFRSVCVIVHHNSSCDPHSHTALLCPPHDDKC